MTFYCRKSEEEKSRATGVNRGGGAFGGICVFVMAMAIALVSLAGCTSSDSGNSLAALFDSQTPEDAVRDAFNVYDADTRRKSISKLSAASFGGERPYVRMYRLLIDDPDPTVRAACLRALGEHGDTEDGRILRDHLTDAYAGVRWEAAKALRKIHDPGAINALVGRLDPETEEDDDVRQAAAEALGQYATRRVYTALITALDDVNFGVIRAAANSLSTLTGTDPASTSTDATFWLDLSETKGPSLFANQRVYTWRPYTRPRGFLDKAQFWKEADAPEDRVPTGLARDNRETDPAAEALTVTE